MKQTIETETEDQELIAGVLNREPGALEVLHARYRGMLKAVILQITHDETEADDVLQDVLIQLWNRAASYSPEKGKLASWLATLARRRAIDRVRQHSAYRRATDRYGVHQKFEDHIVGDRYEVEDEAQRRDLREILARHIELLPLAQREALNMAFFQSRSQREISRLTGTPLGTVKTRIELGVKKLAAALGSRERFA